MYIVAAILGFSLLIIVHELGHFMMAKFNGIKVEEFSIGMGPEIFSRKGKETQYSLRLLPIGGYVKMLGEDEASNDERSFSSKSPLRRISVIIAGATMNIIFALVAFTLVFSNYGFALPVVDKVIENSPALEAGLQDGDEIKKIDGSRVFANSDVSVGIQLSEGNPIELLVDRNGEEKEITVTPKLTTEDGRDTYQIGFYYKTVPEPTITQALKQSVDNSLALVSQTFKSLKIMITGKANFKEDVGGPVTIIRMSGEAAKNGIWSLLNFLGFISMSLAVFNLLPIPALDGGWTVILLIELITRKKVPDKIVGTVNNIGFILLMGLMLVVTLKDILFPVKF